MPSLEISLELEEEAISDLLYLARTAELKELKDFLAGLSNTHNASEITIIVAAIDEFTGNTCLHYAAANGHKSVIEYFASLNSTSSSNSLESLLVKQNLAGNTALHYAALNGNLDVVKFIIDCTSQQSRPSLINCKNNAGHDAAFEAEGNDKSEVVSYLLGVLDEADSAESRQDNDTADTEAFGAAVDQDIAEGAAKPRTDEELEEASKTLSEAQLDDPPKT